MQDVFKASAATGKWRDGCTLQSACITKATTNLGGGCSNDLTWIGGAKVRTVG